MNNTFSIERTSKTGNLEVNLISRQDKLDLISGLMETKSKNPNLQENKWRITYVIQIQQSGINSDQLNMLSVYNGKTTRRKKMSSEDGFKNVKVGNCETESIPGKDLFDEVFL